MIIVGINFFFEHSSVSVIKDGELVFSVEEERLNGIKGGKRYSPYSVHIPFRSLYAALKYLDITIDTVDLIAISYDKWHHLRGLFSKRWSPYDDLYALRGVFHFKRIFNSEYERFQYMSDRLSSKGLERVPIKCFDHHLSHAASAFCYSGFRDSLVLVADCCGEKNCTSIYHFSSSGTKLLKAFPIPHSLGMFYSILTKHLGFDTFQDEYKVMGLASYGEPRFIEEFRNVISYDERGHYRINNKNLFNLSRFLGPARLPNAPITQNHKDLARTAQYILEDILLKLLAYYRLKAGTNDLCMAGGVALNCAANGRIWESQLFERIFVQPASNDAGTSMGAAALAYFDDGHPDQIKYSDMYLGTEYSNNFIRSLLDTYRIAYQEFTDDDLTRAMACQLSKHKVGGLFRGRMETGPRALGNRSIIATPTSSDMVQVINRIKGREMFRPLAPVIKEDEFDNYFIGNKNQYMLFTCSVKESSRSIIPAVTHIDGTSRVQTVTPGSNPFIYKLLDELEKITGVPVLINSSLNFRGRPIIESPADAIAHFYASGLDFLVIGNYYIEKSA